MQAGSFSEWAKRHALIFGLVNEGDMQSILSWLSVFSAMDCTVEELTRATDFISHHPSVLAPALSTVGKEANSNLRFVGKLTMHLAAIQDHVKEQRAAEYERGLARNQPDDRGTCAVCSGTGYVIVPFLRKGEGVKDGKWIPLKRARGGASYYTMAVLCSCPLGHWKGNQFPDEKRPLDLEHYTNRNPYWRDQLRQRETAQLARAALEPMDEAFAAKVKALATGKERFSIIGKRNGQET